MLLVKMDWKLSGLTIIPLTLNNPMKFLHTFCVISTSFSRSLFSIYYFQYNVGSCKIYEFHTFYKNKKVILRTFNGTASGKKTLRHLPVIWISRKSLATSINIRLDRFRELIIFLGIT